MKLSLIAPLSLLATPCTPAFSLQTDVAIVAAAASSSGDCRFVDTQQRIEATGFFSSVDVIDAGAGTPTLAELMTYDAIITWSNFNFADSAALGNVLADYHDAGG
ncbi:MAG: PEP-CTERM sorting domain-containing protein, partial [Planctomycetota bacterium]